MEKNLFISPDYPPPYVGGSLVYVHNLIENSNLNFTILTDRKNRKESNSIRYHESKFIINSSFPSKYQLILMYIYLFLNILKIRKYEKIILNISAIGNGFFSYILSQLNSKVVIIVFAEELTLALKSRGFSGFLKRLCLKGYKKADAIVSISNFAKKILINELGVKCKIKVIPTPVHNSKFYNAKIDERKNFETFRILSVGRLIKRKGFDKLLEAVKDVRDKGYKTQLNIIGNGPEYDILREYIYRNKLDDIVNIFLNASDEFLIEQYKSSNLFVLANLMLDNGDCEGAPNVLIEAAAFGLPTIAGLEGGTSDVVEDNETGLLLDPRNINNFSMKIIDFINDKAKCLEMGKKGYLKAHNSHTKEEAGSIFSSIINDIK